NHIYATLAGIGISNDREGKLLAPSSDGQLRAMRDAYRQAGWRPSDIDLIECHAPGTPVGEVVELASLKELWKEEPDSGKTCILGSEKTNLGHPPTAAGSTGLLKVLLALKTDALPPTANFEKPASQLPLVNSPFQILRKAEEWPRRS